MENQQGIGLIEVLIALIIVSVTGLSLLQQQRLLYCCFNDARLHNRSLQLLENACQSIRVLGSPPPLPQGYQLKNHKGRLTLLFYDKAKRLLHKSVLCADH